MIARQKDRLKTGGLFSSTLKLFSGRKKLARALSI